MRSTRVKGIGPPTSKVSDVTFLQVFPSRTRGSGEGQIPNGLLPLFSVVWPVLLSIETAGE